MKKYLKNCVKVILSKMGYELRVKKESASIVSNIVKSKVSNSIKVPESTVIQYSELFGDVQIGERCLIHKTLLGGNITVGDNTTINGPGTEFYASINNIIIGKFCSIARHTAIQDHNHNVKSITTYFIKKHVFNGERREDKISQGDIIIGNDVWIGTQTVIMPNVTIGHGAVVAANSVVNGDVPAYAIVAGSPAKVLKYRFSDEIISELLKLKWWDWDLSKIRRNKKLFYDDLSIKAFKDIVD